MQFQYFLIHIDWERTSEPKLTECKEVLGHSSNMDSCVLSCFKIFRKFGQWHGIHEMTLHFGQKVEPLLVTFVLYDYEQSHVNCNPSLVHIDLHYFELWVDTFDL